MKTIGKLLISFILLLMLQAMVVVVSDKYTLNIFGEQAYRNISSLFVTSTVQSFIYFSAVLFGWKILDGRKFSIKIGIFIKSLPNLGYGFLFASCLMSIVFVIDILTNSVRVIDTFYTTTPNGSFFSQLIIILGSIAIGVVAEETYFRKYLLINLIGATSKYRTTIRVALILLPLILVHLLTHGYLAGNSILFIINTSLFVSTLVLATIYSGGISFAVGYHIAWNVFLQSIYGYSSAGYSGMYPKLFVLQAMDTKFISVNPAITLSGITYLILQIIVLILIVVIYKNKPGNTFT